jgi:hypothetical protein
MSQPNSNTIRVLGSLAGLIVGAGLGALVGMGFNSILVAAVLGGSVGLILGVCFPRVAGYVLGGFLDQW